MLAFACVASLPLAAAEPPVASSPPPEVTSQLGFIPAAQKREIRDARIPGTVLWASPRKDRLLLQDETRAAVVEGDFSGADLRAGQAVILEGSGAMDPRNFILRLGGAPVVDNDGMHGMQRRSGSVRLSAGRQPIRVTFYNGDGALGLEVFYEGPGVELQKIPSSALFHRPETSANAPFLPGLRYACYLGRWEATPDFRRLTPVKTGIVPNFDIQARARNENAALEFSGFIEIPRDGDYSFHTESDDGSLLFVGGAPPKITVRGAGDAAPFPQDVEIGEPWEEDEDFQWSRVEGRASFVAETAAGWEMELSFGAGRVRLELLDATDGFPPLLLQSRVRATGILASAYTLDGLRVPGRMIVASLSEHIEVLETSREPWAAFPLLSIGELLQMGSETNALNAVRTQGAVLSAGPGRAFVLGDASGQAVVNALQAPPRAVGARVEVAGKWSREGTNGVFQSALYREIAGESSARAESLPVLSAVEQIRSLKGDEAARHYPVALRGVVTRAWAGANYCLFQDATRGIFVSEIQHPADGPLKTGDYLEIEGETDRGGFAPIVLARKVARLGAGRMPEPARPTWDQLMNGSMDIQYVELEGVISSVRSDGITLLLPGGRLNVILEEVSEDLLRRYENAAVKIRGPLSAKWDEQTGHVISGQVQIHLPSINIVQAPPQDLFSTPAKRAAELLQFDARASALMRVKVSGQIMHSRSGEHLVMDGGHGIRIIPKGGPPLHPGDQIEAVGFAELGGPSPMLRDAVARKIGSARFPAPRRLGETNLLSRAHDATRVEIESRLVSMRWNRGEQILELQTATRSYLARLNSSLGRLNAIPVGSLLKIVGTYAVRGGARASLPEIESFEVLLNSPADVTVLETPSWWTSGRSAAVGGILFAILLASLGWNRALRLRVEKRTRELTREIAERKKAEEDARAAESAAGKARESADAANLAKSQFLAAMSHEIRTPMNGVIGMTNLLIESGLNPEQKDFAETARNSGEALLTIINDILDFTKIEAGKLDMEVLDFDFAETVESVGELMAGKAHEKGLELTVFIDRAIPRCLHGDPGRLRQILLNLVSNAVKFTLAGEVNLEARLEGWSDGRPMLRFSARDTGIGLSAATRERLFQPFVQADSSTTRKYGGTGLGLAICRKLAELMGGEIGVQSEPGKGSLFWLTVTLETGASENAEAPEPAPRLEGSRILIVDDNASSRAALQHVAGGWKTRVVAAAASGAEALSQLARAADAGEAFDVVLSDLEMPGMNGIALARAIRAEPKTASVRVVLLARQRHQVKAEELRAAGIAACLGKPARAAHLRRTVNQVLEGAAPSLPSAPGAPSERLEAAVSARPALLLAEDNPVNRKVALSQLRKLGFTADVAGNGGETLKLLREGRYEVVLMDCHMPEMDGYEATRKIREMENNRELPRTWIIAMTANAMEGDREKCLAAGMDDYLSKPVRVSDLAAVLKRAAEHSPSGLK